MTIDQWREEFENLSRNPPPNSSILETVDGSPVKLQILLEEGNAPFIFSRAYVPQIVGGQLGWYAQSSEDHNQTGWKCILLPKARNEIVTRFGLSKTEVYVKSLRVIKKSESGLALLCEIGDW